MLDELVAPGISAFTAATIPDLAGTFPEHPHWLTNHFLNSAVRAKFTPGFRQGALGFLRRMQNAFSDYSIAREKTLAYLTDVRPFNPAIGRYYEAVSAWESVILQTAMGMALFKWTAGGTGMFVRGDGSLSERVYQMANHIKHIGSCFDSGQCGDDQSLPIWLSNEGICSFDMTAAYPEVAELIREMCAFADKLQDPATFREKLQAEVDAEKATLTQPN